MNGPLDPTLRRKQIESLAQGLAQELLRRAKAEQMTRGYRDEDGVWRCGLLSFVRYFWHVLEPQTKFVEGWPIEAIVEHLESVTYGEITRLLINVPPGFMKSMLTDVFWPAWEWSNGLAHHRYVTFSYSASLTERDNDKMVNLISSPEYQEMYGDKVELVKVGNTLISNTATGSKLASSVGGRATGERGDRVILDDPHNVKEAESETVREETTRWFRESMSNRLNDPDRSAIVIIMQRVHEDDVSGLILNPTNKITGYVHLMIPMEYDVDRQIDGNGDPVATAIGWTDPRYLEGEPDEIDGMLAWPERFTLQSVARDRDALGPYAWAGQYQQAPAPRGGGLFQREWWQLWEAPDGKFPVVEYVLASLDSAFDEKEQNDYSALTIWGIFLNDTGNKRCILLHAWHKKLQFSGRRDLTEIKDGETTPAWARRTQAHWGLVEWVKYTCERFKTDKLLIEAKASGISAAQELQNRFPRTDFAVQLCPVKGSKWARAQAVQATFSQLMVYAPDRDWAQDVIDEMAIFPKGKNDDLVDSSTQAIKFLRDNGLLQTDDETRAEIDESLMPPKQKPALYPV